MLNPTDSLTRSVSYGTFSGLSFVFQIYVVFCSIAFGCQYQCTRLPGKPRLWNDLLCVEWDAKPDPLTQLSLQQTTPEQWWLSGVLEEKLSELFSDVLQLYPLISTLIWAGFYRWMRACWSSFSLYVFFLNHSRLFAFRLVLLYFHSTVVSLVVCNGDLLTLLSGISQDLLF